MKRKLARAAYSQGLAHCVSPIPPPPALLLTIIGYPIASALASAVLTSSTRPVPGKSGPPASWASFRARCLSPRLRICCGVGPIHVSPLTSQASAKSALPERNPYPGMTADAPESFAIFMMDSLQKYVLLTVFPSRG